MADKEPKIPFDPADKVYLAWLEETLVDRTRLRQIQDRLAEVNPELLHALLDAATELSPGNPKGHAIYLGRFLTELTEFDTEPVSIT